MTERESLQELIADLVAAAPAAESGPSPDLWAKVEELGLGAVAVDESCGGSGGSVDDLVVIVEALARHGQGLPIIEINTARWILGESGTAVDGSGVPTAVLTDLTEEQLLADGLSIRSVVWGRHAGVVVLCPRAGRPVLVRTDDSAVGIEECVDLSGTPDDTVTVGSSGSREVLDHAPSPEAIRARFALMQSAALVGAVRGAYELTREYVKTREQFGAPLIKIPAVAGSLATIRTKVLEGEAALESALSAWPGEFSGSATPIFSARVVAARCATETARLAHQLHGAMGVTSEYPLHRFTVKLWAWRDAGLPETEWARLVARSAVERGEEWVWTELAVVSSS
ncbi:acyl-CoA/acyl-ACP dehydrogenase [Rhodococcus sp. T2V]|uniref:acyl-CoA dehydrogenase family protein n=1 Tax=Rhodococcus sp. T2V TaxID=3034164 RepID=UPI0023E18AD7|nr:acyl-CoA dehydrogenase family protein [Rhodococcus sp. T2V]MDF3305281.1 acyl-CoA/acyl-ACP dehydrogenase [Rhodococcus sp. T2V]